MDVVVDIDEVGAGAGDVHVGETVETLKTQMAAMQAAIEGQSSSSFFRPKSFCGLSYEDVTDFIERFERYYKLSAIALLFVGPAFAWFHTVPEETRNSYGSLIAALRQ